MFLHIFPNIGREHRFLLGGFFCLLVILQHYKLHKEQKRLTDKQINSSVNCNF